jgi:hypothetical protein
MATRHQLKDVVNSDTDNCSSSSPCTRHAALQCIQDDQLSCKLGRQQQHSQLPHAMSVLCCRPQALAVYQELLRSEDPDPLYHIYSAACQYYMGSIQQAEEAVQQVGGHAC